jgi:hypothetical protein
MAPTGSLPLLGIFSSGLVASEPLQRYAADHLRYELDLFSHVSSPFSCLVGLLINADLARSQDGVFVFCELLSSSMLSTCRKTYLQGHGPFPLAVSCCSLLHGP